MRKPDSQLPNFVNYMRRWGIGIKSSRKEEGPARGDLVRPTRREFRCLLFGDLAPTAFWGKAVANWEGTTFAG